MTKKGKIALALTIITLGVGGYFVYRKMNKSTNKSTLEDFSALKSAVNSRPNSDIFKRISASNLKHIEKKFLEHISNSDAKELISIASIEEKEWTSTQKKLFKDSLIKMGIYEKFKNRK